MNILNTLYRFLVICLLAIIAEIGMSYAQGEALILGENYAGISASSTKLYLNGDRFEVSVDWKNYNDGSSGQGSGVKLTSDSGYFWFFNSSNIELVIKVLDGRPINGCFWVMYGALSDVEYTIQVKDLQTGAGKTYYNAAHNLASYADVRAFPVSGMAQYGAFSGDEYGRLASLQKAQASETVLPNEMPEATSRPEALNACSTTDTLLCLNQSRFSLTVSWRNYNDGTTGNGHAVKLSEDSGYFWFFNSANVELMIKVLDGHLINSYFWIMYGALTDVEYTITITDTQSGTVKTYSNPPRKLASGVDTQAFPWTQTVFIPNPGTWRGDVTFGIDRDSKNVIDFKTPYYGIPECSGWSVSMTKYTTPIINGTFTATGSFYITGAFTSQTTAEGQFGFSNLLLTAPGCFTYLTRGPFPFKAKWSSTAAAVQEELPALVQYRQVLGDGTDLVIRWAP